MANSKSLFRLAQATIRPSESVLYRGLVQPAVLSRPFHTSGWWLDEKKPEKEEDPVSFRLSLYQSTFDRIQRERVENERFAKLRQANDRDYLGATVEMVFSKYIARPGCVSLLTLSQRLELSLG